MKARGRTPLAVGTDTQLAWMEWLVEIKAAAADLAKQLHAVHDDPKYMAVWALSQAHGGRYDGLTYWRELSALDDLLASRPKGPRGSE